MGVKATSLGWHEGLKFGSNDPSAIELASGDTASGERMPAYWWAILLALLVVARYFWEVSEEVG